MIKHFCYISWILGIARGSGWQHIGAYVNLGAFYLVGMPVAIVLGFVVHLRAKGLWIGIVIGSIVQSTILSLITAFTDWKMQVPSSNLSLPFQCPLLFLLSITRTMSFHFE